MSASGQEKRVGGVIVKNWGGVASPRVRTFSERARTTRAAWERFAAGDDDVRDVPAVILLSWQRSRDLYGVDPLNAAPPRAGGTAGASTTSLLHAGVVAQLGGVAAAIAAGTDGSLTTVTDGSGRILGSWGDADTRRRAEDVSLAPLYTWSESRTGTNGLGTSLGMPYPVSVRGPEHWRAALHDWTCHGISVSDAVTGRPLAAVNVSFWRSVCGPPDGMERAVTSIRALLREEAVREGRALLADFVAAADRATTHEAVVVADVAGNVVAANQYAHDLGGHLPPVPAVEPTPRRRFLSVELREIAATAAAHATSDPSWTAVFRVGLLREQMAFAVRPVHLDGGFIGILLVSAVDADGPRLAGGIAQTGGADIPVRVVGIHERQLIILSPHEIRYAAADRHVVWLITDRGRVRAADHGIDNIERALGSSGFLRVHRSYLVNLHRIREVGQGISKGTLTVSTQHHGYEAIPVARRHMPRLRAALGI
jgi:hypothetical protein